MLHYAYSRLTGNSRFLKNPENMPNLDLSIVVVDDAKFSNTVITKTLKNAGYRDIRSASDGASTIALLEQRPASVLVADWLMPGMDGLELAQNVRQIDEQKHHFTYIILLTGKESPDALKEAFEKGIDDFVFKSEMSKQLLPRVYAGDRMAEQMNNMLQANKLLLENNRFLEQNSLLDPETGAGNQRFAHDNLENMLKHTESRDEVTCYIRLDIRDWDRVRNSPNYMYQQELASSITRRLRSVIRPLDILCRTQDSTFVIVAQFKDIEHCNTRVFRRLLDGINLTAFRTSLGFESVTAVISVCCIDSSSPMPSVDEIETKSETLAREALDTSTVRILRWSDSSVSA